METFKKVIINWYNPSDEFIENLFDLYVDYWHTSDSELSLHDFLGLTWEQYTIGVKHGFSRELFDKVGEE